MLKQYYFLKLGLNGITPSGLLVKARNLVSKLTGNAAFANPTPALATVTAAADLLQGAINAYEANPGPNEHTDRTIAFEQVRGLVTDLGGYIQAASGGDLALIKSAGCQVRKERTPKGELPAPRGISAVGTALPGRIDVSWGGVRGRLMYEPEICEGDPNVESNWRVLQLTSKNRLAVTGLKSDVLYYFRVKAIGTAGAGPVSEPAVAKAA